MNSVRVNSVVNVISPGAVSRVNSPSERLPVPRVSRVGQWQEPPGKAVEPGGRYADPVNESGRPFSRLAGVFFSSDGDSAEISGGAMNMFRSRTGGNDMYQFDLRRPFADWPVIQNEPNNPVDFQNRSYPGGAPPITMTPNAVPTGSETSGAPTSVNEPSAAYLDALKPSGECTTCARRRYVDQSDDPSVSYQTPTNISAGMSGAAVAAHESEHVRNNRAKADRDGREIINQSVSITYAFCPECGRLYATGGTTRTTSINKSDSGEDMFSGVSPDRDSTDAKAE